jgi:hypothetical protein
LCVLKAAMWLQHSTLTSLNLFSILEFIKSYYYTYHPWSYSESKNCYSQCTDGETNPQSEEVTGLLSHEHCLHRTKISYSIPYNLHGTLTVCHPGTRLRRALFFSLWVQSSYHRISSLFDLLSAWSRREGHTGLQWHPPWKGWLLRYSGCFLIGPEDERHTLHLSPQE